MHAAIRFILLICMIAGVCLVRAQSDDEVLFTVGDMDVTVGEFKYIYEKNNRGQVDYSEASVREYMDLYTRFKLKVQLARDLKIDTISSLQRELDGYRKQLAKSYLNDKRVTEQLVRELHERMQQDVEVRHILVQVPQNASPDFEEKALNRARGIRQRIVNGENFADLAAEMSDDGSTARHGGYMGYITAMLPNGFYTFETAIYTLAPGELSQPIRTRLGYHIVSVENRRPARGRLELSQILFRVGDDARDEADAERMADSVYIAIANGASFETLARQLSDDDNSAKRGGYIGKVGIGSFDPEFEEKVFAMDVAGEVSEPIRSRVGWHVVKLIRRIPVGDFETERKTLEARIAGNERIEIARKAMLERIREESGFGVNAAVYNELKSRIDESFLEYSWEIPNLEERTIIAFGNGMKKSNVDLANYMKSNTRARMRAKGVTTPGEVFDELAREFGNDMLLEFEESRLASKYPEFAGLMREYEEGILLFEVTKNEVWDRASSDSTGLRNFFETHRDDYVWPQRAVVITYTIDTTDGLIRQKGIKTAALLDPEEWAASLNVNGEVATYEKDLMTAEECQRAEIEWKKDWMSTVAMSANRPVVFKRVTGFVDPVRKELDESRGYVIADYQSYLEDEWVEGLRDKYAVVIHADVLEKVTVEE